MPTKTRIVRIGNSRGIRIPKTLLDEADLPEEVELRAERGRLVVQAVRHARSGWATAAKRMRARNDDRLLDEPTSGLDIISRHRFLEQVEKIGEAGTTLIFVTHHVEEIVPAVERVVLLKDGRVAFDGPKREMLTGKKLTDVFGAPVFVTERDGRFYANA